MKSLRTIHVEGGSYNGEKGVSIEMMYRGVILNFFFSFEKEKNALTLLNAYEVPEISRDRWRRICRTAAAIGAEKKPPAEFRPVQGKLF